MTFRMLAAMTVCAAFTLHAGAAIACGPADVSRAADAEQRHSVGVAIELRTSMLACPPGELSVANQLALANDHASLGDFARAADLIEAVATSAAHDERFAAAMSDAVRYRVALREPLRAKDDVRWLFGATGRVDTTTDRALEVGTALEESRMWTEATQWYQEIATRFPARGEWRIQVRALAGLARAYAALGDTASAIRNWESVITRWPVARNALGMSNQRLSAWRLPEWRPPLPERPRDHRRSRFGAMTESGVDDQNANGHMIDDPEDPIVASFAEAQFRLASQSALAVTRMEMPRYLGPPSRSAYVHWVESELNPWVAQQLWFLRGTLTRVFSEVVNLHSPRWELAANYALAHAFREFECTIRNAPLPPDIRPWREGSEGGNGHHPRPCDP